MIKNIIFDMSEVIISGYVGIEKLMEKKYDIKAEEFLKQKRLMNDRFLDLMRGNISEEEYWKEFLVGKNWSLAIEDLKIGARKYLNQPVEGTMEIVKALKGKYQLILLSDHVREWMKYIEEKNEDIKIFDKKILSYEIGNVKSDKETFNKVLKIAQIVAEETLFIDDYEINIKRAEEVGIYGILFKNAEQLREDLENEYQISVD